MVKRKFVFAFFVLISHFIFYSCTKDGVIDETLEYEKENVTTSDGLIKTLSVIVKNYVSDSSTTRLFYNLDEQVTLKWTMNDTIGIIPSSGSQAAFPIKSTESQSSSAIFDGGGWGLKDDCSYMAYYPLQNKLFLDYTNIPIDYRGQEQVENASTSHLSRFDYMVAEPQYPTNQKLSLTFQHVNALIKFQIQIPKITDIKEFLIVCPDSIIVSGALDTRNKSFKADKKQTSVSLKLQSVKSRRENDVLTFYLMLPPNNLENKDLYLYALSESGLLFGNTMQGLDFTSGHFYLIDSSFHEKERVDTSIGFDLEEKIATDQYLFFGF